MKLSPLPKKIIFVICLVAFLLGIVSAFIVALPIIAGLEQWLFIGSFVLLALGNLLKSL